MLLNWIGEVPDSLPVLSEPLGHWHDYGKAPRDGRKVGHATVTGPASEVAATLKRIATALSRPEQIEPVLKAMGL